MANSGSPIISTDEEGEDANATTVGYDKRRNGHCTDSDIGAFSDEDAASVENVMINIDLDSTRTHVSETPPSATPSPAVAEDDNDAPASSFDSQATRLDPRQELELTASLPSTSACSPVSMSVLPEPEEDVVERLKAFIGINADATFVGLTLWGQESAAKKLGEVLRRVADGALVPLLSIAMSSAEVKKLAVLKGIELQDDDSVPKYGLKLPACSIESGKPPDIKQEKPSSSQLKHDTLAQVKNEPLSNESSLIEVADREANAWSKSKTTTDAQKLISTADLKDLKDSESDSQTQEFGATAMPSMGGTGWNSVIADNLAPSTFEAGSFPSPAKLRRIEASIEHSESILEGDDENKEEDRQEYSYNGGGVSITASVSTKRPPCTRASPMFPATDDDSSESCGQRSWHSCSGHSQCQESDA